jgi:hypothetical protein
MPEWIVKQFDELLLLYRCLHEQDSLVPKINKDLKYCKQGESNESSRGEKIENFSEKNDGIVDNK